jgi:ABC-type phosphate/phosphonate transport system substrate-binding protein
MTVLTSNTEINRVQDLKGKVIGAQAYSHFSGAQAQFYVMEKNGLDFIVDPKQVIFTGRCLLLFSFSLCYHAIVSNSPVPII